MMLPSPNRSSTSRCSRATLRAQRALAERLVGDEQQLLDLERLGDVVVRAELDRADRGLDRAERGDHHDVRRLGQRHHAADQIEAVHLRHAQVGDDQIEAIGARELEPGGGAARRPAPRSRRRASSSVSRSRIAASSSTTRIDASVRPDGRGTAPLRHRTPLLAPGCAGAVLVLLVDEAHVVERLVVGASLRRRAAKLADSLAKRLGDLLERRQVGAARERAGLRGLAAPRRRAASAVSRVIRPRRMTSWTLVARWPSSYCPESSISSATKITWRADSTLSS